MLKLDAKTFVAGVNPANNGIFTYIYHINWLARFFFHQQYDDL